MKNLLSGLSVFALAAIAAGTAFASLIMVTPTGLVPGGHSRVALATSSTTDATSSVFSTLDSSVTTNADGATNNGAVISWQTIVSNSTPKASDHKGGRSPSSTTLIPLVYGTKVSDGNLWSDQVSNPIDLTMNGSVSEGTVSAGALFGGNTSNNDVDGCGMGGTPVADGSSPAKHSRWIQNGFNALAAPQQPCIIREALTTPSSDLDPSTVMLAGLGGLVALTCSFKRIASKFNHAPKRIASTGAPAPI